MKMEAGRSVLMSFLILTCVVGAAYGGLLKSLDEELSSLIEKTEPYLVTVKGEGGPKNLIATGIGYSKDGYIITSSHVYDADNFEVIFRDSSSYPAHPVGVDQQTGLAVLKIDGDFARADWGNTSKLKQGRWILVVGNSYGTPASVNFGTYRGRTDEGFLQLGIDVSPGSSGGAVLNTDGEVVGILVARISFPQTSARDPDYGFNAASFPFFETNMQCREKALAIPAEMVVDIADQLIEEGKVRRGFLGISQRNLTKRELKEYELEGGVRVIDIVEDSPAETAGLREEDIIIEVDGKSVGNSADLYRTVRSHKPGDKIAITYIREGDRHDTDAILDYADDEPFLGGWKLRAFPPKLKAGGKIDIPDLGKLKKQMSHFKLELERMGDELKELQEHLKD